MFLLLVFYPAALGYFQSSDHTCVGLAARNERKLGERSERIEDPAELARVKAQARRVQLEALLGAAALAALALMPPVLGLSAELSPPVAPRDRRRSEPAADPVFPCRGRPESAPVRTA